MYDWVLEMKPNDAAAHVGKALVLMSRSSSDAGYYIDKSLELDPRGVGSLIAASMWHCRRFDVAKSHYFAERAYSIHPSSISAVVNLIDSSFTIADYKAVRILLSKYLPLHPDNAKLNMAAAQLFLQVEGDATRAWKHWESRDSRRILTEKMMVPEWDGQNIAGKTLLVVGEHGIGDQIMFSRWLPLIERASQAKILVKVKPILDSWFSSHLFALATDANPINYWVGMSSGPEKTGTPICPPLKRYPRHHSSNGRKLVVGFAWHGDPNTPCEFRRPIRTDLFTNLLKTPGVEFRSLQLGETIGSMPKLEDGDILNTEHQISRCDLVITSDTSICHLAGTMRVPTWVMMYNPPEWRWELCSTSTMWYNSLKIYRQTVIGQWNDVVDRIQRDLRELVESNAT